MAEQIMSPGEFRRSMEILGLSYDDVARLNGTHHVTVRRWVVEGQKGPPKAAAILMGIMLARSSSVDDMIAEAASAIQDVEDFVAAKQKREAAQAAREAKRAQASGGGDPPKE